MLKIILYTLDMQCHDEKYCLHSLVHVFGIETSEDNSRLSRERDSVHALGFFTA